MKRKDFLINLFACEKRFNAPVLDDILEALELVSLVFSCLFMLELLASVWAFGFQ
jgi:voltage-gated hydrogen channel 1